MHLPFGSALAAWEFPFLTAHVRVTAVSRHCPSPCSLFELPITTAFGKADFPFTVLLLLR